MHGADFEQSRVQERGLMKAGDELPVLLLMVLGRYGSLIQSPVPVPPNLRLHARGIQEFSLN